MSPMRSGHTDDERKVLRANRLLNAVRLMNRSLLRSTNRAEMLKNICDIAVERGDFLHASVSLAVSESEFHILGSCSRDDWIPEPIGDAGSYHERQFQSVARKAIETGHPYIDNKFLGNPTSEVIVASSTPRGTRSLAIFPIPSQDPTRSILILCSDKGQYFEKQEIESLQDLVQDMGVRLSHFTCEQERDRLEDVLKRKAGILESSHDAILSEALDGTILGWNPAAERMFGYAESESIGLPIATILPKERIREDGMILAGVCRGDRIVDFETVRVRRNGEHFPVSISVTPLRLSSGEIVGASKVIRDITERKQAATQLQEALAQFKLVVDNLDEGLVLFDSKTGELRWNPVSRRMHGFAREQDCPVRLQDCIGLFEIKTLDHKILPSEQWPMSRAIRGEELQEVEVRLRRLDDSCAERVFAYYGSTVRYASGRVLAFMTIKDVTDRKLAEAALVESNLNLERRVEERTAELAIAKDLAESGDRLKSAFLATMSHELRTPLNSIIGFTGILIQRLAGPLNEEQGRQLEMVRGSAQHLLALINDVLDISKIEANKIDIRIKPFDLGIAVEALIGTIMPLARKKGLHLQIDSLPFLDEFVGDKRRVEQVLLNLLSNAVKFTQSGEVTLTVDCLPKGDPFTGLACECVRFRVKDTGIGILPEDLETLFQPFRQIDNGLAHLNKGTGLGLAISRKLALLMGGEVYGQSQYGMGSVFTFVLPGYRKV